jgi:hypothetical protein
VSNLTVYLFLSFFFPIFFLFLYILLVPSARAFSSLTLLYFTLLYSHTNKCNTNNTNTIAYKIRWHGKDRVKFVEKMVVGDIQGLDKNHGCLSLITNDQGGIMDDTVIVNAGMSNANVNVT